MSILHSIATIYALVWVVMCADFCTYIGRDIDREQIEMGRSPMKPFTWVCGFMVTWTVLMIPVWAGLTLYYFNVF